MDDDPRNPGPGVRAAAKVMHDHDLDARKAHGPYKSSYEELEATDSIGFEEYNELIMRALEAYETKRTRT